MTSPWVWGLVVLVLVLHLLGLQTLSTLSARDTPLAAPVVHLRLSAPPPSASVDFKPLPPVRQHLFQNLWKPQPHQPSKKSYLQKLCLSPCCRHRLKHLPHLRRQAPATQPRPLPYRLGWRRPSLSGQRLFC